MKTKQQLINNIIGQLNGIGKMIDDEKVCSSVIMQMKAVKSAVNNLTNKYIEDNIMNCVEGDCSKKNKDLLKDLILQITKNN
jgi:CsoR family transcriptional regulator, copper-sensing transcriptional repressor